MNTPPSLHWVEDGQPRSARWRSEAGLPPPAKVRIADDRLAADEAWRLASEGWALLWRGDYQNARQLMQALARRADRAGKARKGAREMPGAFHAHRMRQAQRARMLGSVLVPMAGDHAIALGRAPDVRDACREAWGEADAGDSVVALREVLGVIGAHEWRKNGVEIPALGAAPGNRIHPHYGVFSPVRGEYLDLVARAPLPGRQLAFDIGTGTGVIAAILVRRGVKKVVATDLDPRALACARENLQRLGVADAVTLEQCDLFPPGRADLVVCNPPWLPGRPSAPIERAIYDEGSRMLRGFLTGLCEHLAPRGEGWLILSDLAEHLRLRAPGELAGWIESAGLVVTARMDARPSHPKAADREDPLHEARSREVTSLWRLAPAAPLQR